MMTYPIPLWLALVGWASSAIIAAVAMGLVCSRKREPARFAPGSFDGAPVTIARTPSGSYVIAGNQAKSDGNGSPWGSKESDGTRD